MVNYLKDFQVDSQYVKILLDNELSYGIKLIDYFSSVYEKYLYPKIPLKEVLGWFEISGSNAPIFKNPTYYISLSYTSTNGNTNGIKQVMKNFFEKVCTEPDIMDKTDPDYVKYTQIVNWLNTK